MKMTDSMHMIKIRILLENAYVGWRQIIESDRWGVRSIVESK